MAVKMNLRIITKNHAADPEIGFIAKLISMPTAWELKFSSKAHSAYLRKNIIIR